MQSFCLNVTLWYHFHDWPLARTSLNEISDSRGDFSSDYFRCSYFPSSLTAGDVPFQAMCVVLWYTKLRSFLAGFSCHLQIHLFYRKVNYSTKVGISTRSYKFPKLKIHFIVKNPRNELSKYENSKHSVIIFISKIQQKFNQEVKVQKLKMPQNSLKILQSLSQLYIKC